MVKFESPMEEALQIAFDTRKKILEDSHDYVSILRGCLVVATTLSKQEEMVWINCELHGLFETIPPYRKINCRCKNIIGNSEKRKDVEVTFGINYLDYYFKKNEDLIMILDKKDEFAIVLPVQSLAIIGEIINKCLVFLNKCLSELQYGGYLQSFFDNIRMKVDSKLTGIDIKISQEMQSITVNLASANPQDWPKVAHSCRRVMKFFSDKISPPSDIPYKMKDGETMGIKDNQFINRLIRFLDEKSENVISLNEAKLLGGYLRTLNEEVQDDEHKPEISKYEASKIALHTYLILAEVLNYYQLNSPAPSSSSPQKL
jgi:hypothetical protein